MATNTPPPAAIRNIALDTLVESRTNPRKEFNPEALKELTDSIKEKGILQALTVRPLQNGADTKNGTFEIIFGARRFRSAKAGGLEEVPCQIRTDLSDADVVELQLVENLQRDDLDVLEEAAGFHRLRKKHGKSIAEIAAAVGKSARYIYDRITMVSDLSVAAKELHGLGYLTPSHLVELARLNEKSQAEALGSCFRVHRPNLSASAIAKYHKANQIMVRSIQGFRDDIARNIHRSLSAAGWGMSEQFTKGITCASCKHRTDALGSPEAPIKGNAGKCLRPECYEAKKVEYLKNKHKAMEEADGRPVPVLTFGSSEEETVSAAGLKNTISRYDTSKAKPSARNAVRALDVSTGKATWIKNPEKTGQNKNEAAQAVAKRKKERAKEKAEMARRQELLVKALRRIPSKSRDKSELVEALRAVVSTLSWQCGREERDMTLRILHSAGVLTCQEYDLKDIEYDATIEDLVAEADGPGLLGLLVVWHCRGDAKNWYGDAYRIKEIVSALKLDQKPAAKKKPKKKKTAKSRTHIPATELAARNRKARGKAPKKKRKKRARGS